MLREKFGYLTFYFLFLFLRDWVFCLTFLGMDRLVRFLLCVFLLFMLISRLRLESFWGCDGGRWRCWGIFSLKSSLL